MLLTFSNVKKKKKYKIGILWKKKKFKKIQRKFNKVGCMIVYIEVNFNSSKIWSYEWNKNELKILRGRIKMDNPSTFLLHRQLQLLKLIIKYNQKMILVYLKRDI